MLRMRTRQNRTLQSGNGTWQNRTPRSENGTRQNRTLQSGNERTLFFVDSRSVGRRRLKMRKLPVIVAAASALWAFPAFAGQLSAPGASEPVVTLAQFDLCVGPDCRDRGYRDRRYDRAYDYDRDWRYRRDDRRCR